MTTNLYLGDLRLCSLAAIIQYTHKTSASFKKGTFEHYFAISQGDVLLASFTWDDTQPHSFAAYLVEASIARLIGKARAEGQDAVVPVIRTVEHGRCTLCLDFVKLFPGAIHKLGYVDGFMAAFAIIARNYADIAHGADGNGLDGYEEVGAGKLMATLRQRAIELGINLPAEKES